MAFFPAFLAGAGIKFPGLHFISPLTLPLSYAGPVAGIWTALGIAYLIYLYAKHPDRIRETGRVFLEEPPATAAEPAPPPPAPAQA